MMADETLKNLFYAGYTYKEIQLLLHLDFSMKISLRQLKRHLKRLGLRRRREWDGNYLRAVIQSEIEGSGPNLGCRAMSKRLLSKYGMNVGRDTVLQYQHTLEPEGVERRSRHCLFRREYRNKGPNFLIHIDGYDKLKRYGFAIHGAICGFSRRILWLKVARTNNDPHVIAGYFMQYVQEIEGVPRCIRMDTGTENIDVIDMQKALRWYHGDTYSGEKSVIVGSSHSNQRIEAWWRQLRRLSMNFWMETFSTLEEEQLLSTASNLDIECLRFCFMNVIQTELDRSMKEWNEHKVRLKSDIMPAGKPDLLYHHPELYGARDYKFPVNMADVETLKQMCVYPPECLDDARHVFTEIVNRKHLRYPDTIEEAIQFLRALKRP